MRKFYFTVITTSLLLFFVGCTDNKVEIIETYYGEENTELLEKYLNLPKKPYSYNFSLPKHTFLSGVPADKDLTALGRVLFYDTNLSKDKTISCASCHKQELAFSDNVAFSEGIENRVTARNSIALGSVLNFSAYYGGFSGVPFFWDNRANSVQDQSRATLANPNEMGMSMNEVVDRVEDLEYYKPLIEKAFPWKKNVNGDDLLDAIGSFVNSLTNYDTKFDRELDNRFQYKVNEHFPGFTDSENRGKTLFLSHCASCHGSNSARPPVISANNGLMLSYDDAGEGTHNTSLSKVGLFKVPTLRNITRTAPYMHNGMFATLEEVIDHYSTGIQNYANLSNQLKVNNQPVKFNFTAQQKEDLIAFLHTLNDDKITTDPKFSDPFKR